MGRFSVQQISYYYQTKLVQKTIGDVKDPTDLSSLKNKNNPVVVDDFASLYPSIMIAYNICYTTKISFAKVRELEAAGISEGVGYYKIPTTPVRYFVTPKIRKGIIPEILEHLLKERKKQKVLMKAAYKRGDLTEAAIKNGTQMALKTSANSIYGFTGSIAYRDIDVCESVTGVGRHVILLSKKVMEEHFTVKNGYPRDAKVIYGFVYSLLCSNIHASDTDSVMVILADNLEDSYKIGKEAAKLATEAINQPPISLEFEKIYYPYILFSRKKYVGLLYERPDGKAKYDAKGVANKRRDTCLLIKRLLVRMANIYMNKEAVPKEFEGTKTDYAISICRDEYRRTLEGNVRFEELILSKGMSKPEDEYAKDNRVPAHISLVRRIKRRRPGTEPQAGDRVFYVLVDKGHKSYVHKMSARPEDVLEHNLPIAYWKYAELLKKEVCRFFASILSGGYGKIDYENWNEKRRKDEINKIIKKNIGIAEKIIFGNLRVKVKKPTYGVGAIEKFLVRIPKCLKCKTKLVVPSKKRRKVKKSRKGKKQDVEEDCLCEKCAPEKHKMLSEYLHKRRLLIQKADAIEKQCLACQEETYGLVKCGNNECKYFYLKDEIQLDIEDIDKNLGCLMTSYKNGEIKKCNGLIQKLKVASRCVE